MRPSPSGSLAVTIFLQSEGMSTVKLGKMIDCELDEKEEKQKKKKSKKEEAVAEDEPSEPSDEVTTLPTCTMTILTHNITLIFTNHHALHLSIDMTDLQNISG